MKSRWFLVVFLVLGLALITASAKAGTSAKRIFVSNAAISYFQTNDSLSTVICVFNTNPSKARIIHLIVFNEKSQHVVDRTYKLTHWGTAVFQVSLTAEGDYVLIKGVGGDKDVKGVELYAPVGTADHEVHDLGGGVYGGYIQITEVASESNVTTPAWTCTVASCPDGCEDENAVITYDLAVATALIGPNWWVGLVPYGVRIDECSGDLLSITELEGAIRAIDSPTGNVNLYGRWWDSDTVNSTLVLIDPARYDDPNKAGEYDYKYKQKTMAYLYDENQKRIRSFSIEAPEVYRSSSPFDGTSEESGWIEIDNVTATTNGFILVEEAGKCDMLPLFKQEIGD